MIELTFDKVLCVLALMAMSPMVAYCLKESLEEGGLHLMAVPFFLFVLFLSVCAGFCLAGGIINFLCGVL